MSLNPGQSINGEGVDAWSLRAMRGSPWYRNGAKTLTRTRFMLSLRGARRRGNPVTTPTGPFVLSLSKDPLRVFDLIEIANPCIEYGVAMTLGDNRKTLRWMERRRTTPPSFATIRRKYPFQ